MPGRTEGSSSGCPVASGPPSALPVPSRPDMAGLSGRGTVPGVGVGRWGPEP